jgi:hypothetical protein
MKARAIGLFLTVVFAACEPPAGQVFQTTLLHTSPDNPSGDYPLPVSLGDRSGLVVGIEQTDGDPSDGIAPVVQSDPANRNALILSWLGGMCDNDATVSFQRAGSRYELNLAVHPKIGLGCPAAGILRGLRIVTSEPVPPGSIVVSGKG